MTVICYCFSQDRVMVSNQLFYEYVVNLSIFKGKRTSASEATSTTSDQNVSSHFPDFQASSGIEFGPVGHLSRFGKVQLALRGSASRQHRLRLGKEGLVFRTGKLIFNCFNFHLDRNILAWVIEIFITLEFSLMSSCILSF